MVKMIKAVTFRLIVVMLVTNVTFVTVCYAMLRSVTRLARHEMRPKNNLNVWSPPYPPLINILIEEGVKNRISFGGARTK